MMMALQDQSGQEGASGETAWAVLEAANELGDAKRPTVLNLNVRIE